MRLFGTNGIRGIANKDLTSEFALKLAKAIGTYFGGDIAIAMDTRMSGEMIKNAVVSGLLSTGCNVYDANIAPTPALQYYVKNGDFDGGVIITASHNPPEYNGIKVVDRNGEELQREEEEKIEDIFSSEKFKSVAWNEIGSVYSIDIIDFYIEGILENCGIEAKDFKVVIDCGNGATCLAMPYLLASVSNVITINAEPRGLPSRLPEPTHENLKDLINCVKSMDADIGIAYDGDGDRAIFISEDGKYIQGDYSLAIIAGFKVEEKKGKVVVPVSTSSCVEKFVKSKGGEIFYTKIGARNVAKKMKELNAVFGGEENGGLIFPEHQYCRDGGMASIYMLKIMAEKGKKLSEILNEVPKYHISKEKIECKDKEKVMNKIREESSGKIDLTDGIKIFTQDGFVLIRASGTEPIIRIYAESKSKEEAENIARKYKERIKEISKFS